MKNTVHLGALLAGSLVLGNALPSKATTSYSFNLPASATTSAGVFKTDGTLIRTLWRKVALSAGTHNSSTSGALLHWDDKDDDGNTVAAGNYQIRVLYHNVNYTWEGVIGNTSSTFNGTGAHYNFLAIQSMAFSGNNGFYCAGYNESHFDFTKFNASDPLTATDHFAKYFDSRFNSISTRASDLYGRQWHLAAADGNTVYFANPAGYDTSTNNNMGKPGFVVKYNAADTSAAYFTTAGQNIDNGPNDDPGWGDAHQYRKFVSGIYVGTQPGLSGLAVQNTGNILAVAVGPDNKVYLYNKGTGASLGNLSVTNPRHIAFAPNNDLWVITGGTVKRYTGVGSTNTVATTINGLSNPVSVGVHPTNNNLVLVADGGSSQQIKGFTSTGGVATGWTTPLGQAGGFATNGPSVSTTKFWFKEKDASPGTFIAFQPDGSFWIGDEGNMRSLHFSAARNYLHQIQYSPYVRTVSADLNNPTRVFNAWAEYEVNYGQTLQPGDSETSSTGWKLVRNWGHGLGAPYTNNGLDNNGLQTVVTMANDRTWAMVNRNDGPREIAELRSTGLHLTGITFSGTSSLYANGDIRDYSVNNGTLTITRRQVSFDGAGNPSWGSPQTLATAPAGSRDPVHHGGYTGANGPRFPSTSTGVVVSLDSSAAMGGYDGNLGMHLGGIKEGTSGWNWKGAPGIVTGGIDGDGSDTKGSYPVDGDNFGGWNGTTVWTAGRNVVYHYNGQASNSMNRFNHFWDDGLFIGQYGTSDGWRDFPGSGPKPGLASHAFSPCLVQVNDKLYMYQSDEMMHSGVHRWRMDNLSSIKEISGTGPRGGAINFDSVAPTVSISTPANGASTTASSITFSGSASDNIGVTSVTWSTDRGYSGTAAGTNSWSANVQLAPGANVVTITARDAAGNTATATRTVNGTNSGLPVIGATISLKAMANGKYVKAEPSGTNALIASADAVGSWEKFLVENAGNGNVYLKALSNNQYVCTEGGGGELFPNRATPNLWETFTMFNAGSGLLTLKSLANGKFVCADNGGDSPLIPNRDDALGWETFQWTTH